MRHESWGRHQANRSQAMISRGGGGLWSACQKRKETKILSTNLVLRIVRICARVEEVGEVEGEKKPGDRKGRMRSEMITSYRM